MIEQNCGTCFFWLAGIAEKDGTCHRFPPLVFPMLHQAPPMLVGQQAVPVMGSLTLFPTTKKTCEGCGEWKDGYEKTG
jgi:hypothetical protein